MHGVRSFESFCGRSSRHVTRQVNLYELGELIGPEDLDLRCNG